MIGLKTFFGIFESSHFTQVLLYVSKMPMRIRQIYPVLVLVGNLAVSVILKYAPLDTKQ